MSDSIAVRVIEDPMELYRRVHPGQVVPDKNTGQLRPSSAAFKDPSMSSMWLHLWRSQVRTF